jgi:hypothetical protein
MLQRRHAVTFEERLGAGEPTRPTAEGKLFPECAFRAGEPLRGRRTAAANVDLARGSNRQRGASIRPRLRKVPTRSRQERMTSSSVAAMAKTSRQRAFLSILNSTNLFSVEFSAAL